MSGFIFRFFLCPKREGRLPKSFAKLFGRKRGPKQLQKTSKKCSMKSAKDTGLITELAIAYREAGKYPVSDDELERIIKELKDLLAKEK